MDNYIKYDNNEPIEPGDILSIKESNKLVRSFSINNKNQDTHVIGVCTHIDSTGNIQIKQQGTVDIKVQGIVCLGDKITLSDIPGVGCAIRYDQEEEIFNIRSIGKVIQLYNDIYKATILLDIE